MATTVERKGRIDVPTRVDVAPELLVWALERSGQTEHDLAIRFPKLEEWVDGAAKPTLRQLEKYAAATHTPVGYLFLREPPDVPLPVPDYRTIGDAPAGAPSPDLLDTVYGCEHRQDWYRDFAVEHGLKPVEIVGAGARDADPVQAAGLLCDVLGFGMATRTALKTWDAAYSALVQMVEAAGALVMTSGIVGSNTHRVLDPAEFRGFVLVDTLAPVIFVNGADTKAAQIFTLAHEVAHLWIAESGVDRPDPASADTGAVERWCNQVAAEFLVPLDDLEERMGAQEIVDIETLERLARVYKVSTLVVLSRLYDAARLDWDSYRSTYRAEVERILALPRRPSSGGDFYNTQPLRVSKRLARAVIEDTLDGRTLYGDAFQLLGFKKAEAFGKLAEKLGVR